MRPLFFKPGGLGVEGHKAMLAHWRMPTMSRTMTAFQDGPGGHQGEFFHFGTTPENTPSVVGYDPERQEWHEHPDGLYWVGWVRDERPTAADLKRDDTVESLRAGDWWAPVCGPRQTKLPQSYKLAAGGKMTATVMQEYQSLWERSERVFGVMTWDGERDAQGNLKPGQPMPELDDLWVGEYAADALAVNYAIDRFLFCVLGIDTVTANLITFKTVALEYVRPNAGGSGSTALATEPATGASS